MDVKKTISQITGLIKTNEYDEAITLLKKIIETDSRNELALGLLASVYAEINMDNKSIELYQKILKINPNNPLARYHLGMIHFANNQFDEAIDIWLASVTDEKNFVLHYYLGLAYMQKQQEENARPMFEKAKQYMPDNHPLYKDLIESLGNQHNIH